MTKKFYTKDKKGAWWFQLFSIIIIAIKEENFTLVVYLHMQEREMTGYVLFQTGSRGRYTWWPSASSSHPLNALESSGTSQPYWKHLWLQAYSLRASLSISREAHIWGTALSQLDMGVEGQISLLPSPYPPNLRCVLCVFQMFPVGLSPSGPQWCPAR